MAKPKSGLDPLKIFPHASSFELLLKLGKTWGWQQN
jgi:hypothetical protein